MIAPRRVLLLIAIGLSLIARPASAAEPAADTNAAWFGEHYTKYEHRIAMRDGVRLFTRTPYALKPYGSENYTSPVGSFRTLARDKFILVTQDVRRAIHMSAVGLAQMKTTPLGKFYAHLRAAGKPAKAALATVMRKLLLQMNQELKPA